MFVRHRWTLGKQATERHLNEDAVACSPTRGIFAVSDGASESYASGPWARRLVMSYVRNPDIDRTWLDRAVSRYNRDFDRANMTWSAQAAFDRGSFATLLGARVGEAGADILAVGDTLAVLTDGGRIRFTHPYENADQFRANPLLLSTLHERNDKFVDAVKRVSWSFEKCHNPILLFMTDAVGAWLLTLPEERLKLLTSLKTQGEFVQLVEAAREDGSMRRDDSTLLIIG